MSERSPAEALARRLVAEASAVEDACHALTAAAGRLVSRAARLADTIEGLSGALRMLRPTPPEEGR